MFLQRILIDAMVCELFDILMLMWYCRSLSPLFDNPKLDKDLCAMLKENFAEFCSTDVRPNSGE